MSRILYDFFARDHQRLEALLNQAVARPDAFDDSAYAEFRKGLLRHIAMEEKTVMPTIARLQDGRQAPYAERIHLDHSALAALLVPPPSASVIATIRSILRVHNALEEQEGGLYQLFEQLVGTESDAMLEKLKATPEVPVLPHNTKLEVLEATRRAVARAGYEFKDVPE